MKDAFDGQDVAEERISELGTIAIESLKVKNKENKDRKEQQNIQRL